MNNDVVVIKLDKPRTVRLGNKALKKLEAIFSCSVTELVSRLESLSIEELNQVMYQGLLHEDKELTLEATEDLLDEHCTYLELLKTIVDAFKVALKKPEGLELDPNAPRTVAKKK